jgi:hypothetical protein
MDRQLQCKRCSKLLVPADALIVEPPWAEPRVTWSEDDGEIVCAGCVIPEESNAGRVFEYGPDGAEEVEVIESRPWVSSTDDVLEGRE